MSQLNSLWTRGDFALWHIRGSNRTPLLDTAILRFTTDGDARNTRTGTLTLSFYFPADAILLHLRLLDQIEIRHLDCGPPTHYDLSEPFITLLVEDIQGPTVTNLLQYDRAMHATMEVQLTGHVEIADPNDRSPR